METAWGGERVRGATTCWRSRSGVRDRPPLARRGLRAETPWRLRSPHPGPDDRLLVGRRPVLSAACAGRLAATSLRQGSACWAVQDLGDRREKRAGWPAQLGVVCLICRSFGRCRSGPGFQSRRDTPLPGPPSLATGAVACSLGSTASPPERVPIPIAVELRSTEAAAPPAPRIRVGGRRSDGMTARSPRSRQTIRRPR